MYALDLFRRRRPWQGPFKKVNPTVWYLGFTSLFTDISSEMVSSILPLYFLAQLGLTPLQFGFVDGLYQGVTALSRLASGFLADRWRKYKEIALLGYGLSALCKPAFLVIGRSWEVVGLFIAIDRTGKGIRTAPRDALISLNSNKENLGTAFGVHRSMDALGAMLGPAAAFLILTHTAGAFDAVFMVSFFLAIIGLGVLALFVSNPGKADAPSRRTAASFTAMMQLTKNKHFLFLLLVSGLLSLATMSDSFIYLGIQQRWNIPARVFPLFYLGTSLFYVLLSIPLGRWADRGNPFTVYLGGHCLLLMVYALPLCTQTHRLPLLLALALLGAYYAATDGILMARAAEILPPALCASGLALLSTVTTLGRFMSSLITGSLWSQGSAPTMKMFIVGLALAILIVILSQKAKHLA